MADFAVGFPYFFDDFALFLFEGQFFALKQGEAYLFDAWTLMQYRGKKVAPYLRYQTYKAMAKRGVANFYSISELVNSSTRKFKNKLHAREIEFAVYVCIFNRISEYNCNDCPEVSVCNDFT